MSRDNDHHDKLSQLPPKQKKTWQKLQKKLAADQKRIQKVDSLITSFKNGCTFIQTPYASLPDSEHSPRRQIPKIFSGSQVAKNKATLMDQSHASPSNCATLEYDDNHTQNTLFFGLRSGMPASAAGPQTSEQKLRNTLETVITSYAKLSDVEKATAVGFKPSADDPNTIDVTLGIISALDQGGMKGPWNPTDPKTWHPLNHVARTNRKAQFALQHANEKNNYKIIKKSIEALKEKSGSNTIDILHEGQTYRFTVFLSNTKLSKNKGVDALAYTRARKTNRSNLNAFKTQLGLTWHGKVSQNILDALDDQQSQHPIAELFKNNRDIKTLNSFQQYALMYLHLLENDALPAGTMDNDQFLSLSNSAEGHEGLKMLLLENFQLEANIFSAVHCKSGKDRTSDLTAGLSALVYQRAKHTSVSSNQQTEPSLAQVDALYDMMLDDDVYFTVTTTNKKIAKLAQGHSGLQITPFTKKLAKLEAERSANDPNSRSKINEITRHIIQELTSR